MTSDQRRYPDNRGEPCRITKQYTDGSIWSSDGLDVIQVHVVRYENRNSENGRTSSDHRGLLREPSTRFFGPFTRDTVHRSAHGRDDGERVIRSLLRPLTELYVLTAYSTRDWNVRYFAAKRFDRVIFRYLTTIFRIGQRSYKQHEY